MDNMLIKKKRKRIKLTLIKQNHPNLIIKYQNKQLNKNKINRYIKKSKKLEEKVNYNHSILKEINNEKFKIWGKFTIKTINFEVDSWSSYISNFHPKNICIDSKLSGQLSKWSVDFKSQNEYVYLKLEKTSIINSITFGKFRDPTNLKEFKILAGLNKTDMIEILHSGLSYDMEYEPFTVKNVYKGILIPCNYLKLIPIRPWDDNYNISVWFINLKGTDDEFIVQEAIYNFNLLKDRENKYNWLSLTRQIFKEQSCEILKLNQIDSLMHVLEETNITKLFEFLMRGKYYKAIKTLKKMENENLFDSHIRELPYKLFYRRIDYVTDEINNIIINAKINENILNHFKIYREEEDLSDTLSEYGINIKSLKKTTIEKGEIIQEITCNNDSVKAIEETNYITNQRTNTNAIVNRLENLLNNINNINDNINNHAHNDNDNNEVSELDDYDLELNELKMDSLLSQNYDLDDSNFELNMNKKMEESINKNTNSPCGRGGHTMVLDEENFLIYLFGGWDGSHELDDFWCFDIKNENWNLISSSTNADKGPSPRSCHRMVYDSLNKKIFIYGRYKSTQETKNNRLYEFDVNNNKWSSFIIDKEKDEKGVIFKGGPGQIYDHQMVIDSKNQIIYIFGGIKIPEKEDLNEKYLGLWSLDLKDKTWKNLFANLNQDQYDLKLRPRTGHSMLFDPINHELIIIGGNRISKKKNEYTSQLFEIIIYEIKSKTLKELFHDYSKEKGPDVNFSLNAFFNYEKREIIIFGGGLKSDKQDIVSNNFWVLNIDTKKWDKVKKANIMINYDAIMQEDVRVFFENKHFLYNHHIQEDHSYSFSNCNLTNLTRNVNLNNSNDSQVNEPMPRFAHSLIYSIKLNKGFIFGGNPYIKTSHCCVRFSDFWTFSLIKPDSQQIINMIKYKILKLSFIDACANSRLEKAINVIKQIKKIDCHNKNEINMMLRNFLSFDHNLCEKDIHLSRYELFDEIRKYFNDYH